MKWRKTKKMVKKHLAKMTVGDTITTYNQLYKAMTREDVMLAVKLLKIQDELERKNLLISQYRWSLVPHRPFSGITSFT